MSDKNNVRGDIYNAIAKTYRPKVPVPEGGRRDTLEYAASPRAKLRPQPLIGQGGVRPAAGPGVVTDGDLARLMRAKRGRKVVI